MKSLRSFLLEEVKKSKRKKEPKEKTEVPDGFEPFPTAGPLTKQIQSLLQIDQSSEMNLDNKNLKITTKEGQKEIVTDLDLKGASNFISLFTKLSKSKKMEYVFNNTRPEKLIIDEKMAIKMHLRNGYEKIGGRQASTLKFIKFWCTCAAIAAGVSRNKAESYEYYLNDRGNVMLVVNV